MKLKESENYKLIFSVLIFLAFYFIFYYFVMFEMYWTDLNMNGEYLSVYFFIIGILLIPWVYFHYIKYVRWFFLFYFIIICNIANILSTLIYYAENLSEIWNLLQIADLFLLFITLIFSSIPIGLTFLTIFFIKRYKFKKT